MTFCETAFNLVDQMILETSILLRRYNMNLVTFTWNSPNIIFQYENKKFRFIDLTSHRIENPINEAYYSVSLWSKFRYLITNKLRLIPSLSSINSEFFIFRIMTGNQTLYEIFNGNIQPEKIKIRITK